MKIKIFLLCLAVLASGYFRTGCLKNAEAANTMITQTYSFSVVQAFTITSQTPANGATGVGREQVIDVSFTHPLPVTAASIYVTIGGQPVAGTQIMTSITGGKRVVWTPSAPFPMQADVLWTLSVTVTTP